MSEWRELKTLQDVAAAQVNGEEIEHRHHLKDWHAWSGGIWCVNYKYRARPKAETVTVRRALFDQGAVFECTEKYAETYSGFVCWLGDPVTYEVKKGGA